MEWTIKQIGIIHTPYNEMKDIPIQGVFEPDGKGIVEVFPEYQEGLKDIEIFSHIILLYYFHLVDEIVLVRKPFLDNEKHGIFSIRAPNRPNPIGFSIAKLLERIENKLYIAEIDVMNGTPLIDIKPYVPNFDIRTNATRGWLEGKI